MRRKIILLLVLSLFTLKVFAQTSVKANSKSPANVAEFLTLSAELREKAKSAKDFKGKTEELKKLEKEFIKVRAELKKKYPKKGPPEEKPINVFFYTLEPVFEIAKKSEALDKDCNEAARQIKADDRSDKKETDPVDKDSAEGLAWVSVLCDELKP